MPQFNSTMGDLETFFITESEFLDRYSNASLYAWGNNSSGQLGIGNTTSCSSPIQVGTEFKWKSIDTSANSQTVGCDISGVTYVWGDTMDGTVNVPTTLVGMTPAVEVSISLGAIAVIKQDGSLWMKGDNDQGQLGRNTSSGVAVSAIEQTSASGNNWKYIRSSRWKSFMAIKTDGSLWGWGYNNVGQLGNNSIESKSNPTQVHGNTNDWKYFSTGQYNSAAIKKDGSLYTWGLSGSQLGSGSVSASRSTPYRVGNSNNWKYVSVGNNGFHMLAIKTNGTLWGWGQNNVGQLGTNGPIDVDVYEPVRIGSGTDWKTVKCADNSSYGIKTDGTIWSWGLGLSGRLGLGNVNNKSIPTQIGADSTWLNISAGDSSCLALKYA